MGRLTSVRQLEIARANVERQRKGKWNNLVSREISPPTPTSTIEPVIAEPIKEEPIIAARPIAYEAPSPIAIEEQIYTKPIDYEAPVTERPIAPANVTVEVNSPSALEPNLPSGGGGGFGGAGASSGGGKAPKKKSYTFYWIGAAVLAGVIYLNLKTKK